MTEQSDTLRDQLRRRFLRVGQRLIWAIESWIGRSSLIGDTPFFDPQQFPWVATLENNWRDIRRELDQVLERYSDLPNFQDLSKDQRHLTSDDQWKTYFFYAYGLHAKNNCARCPATARLIESVPGMKTAFFSILGPRKHIPEHRGPYKGVIRYHLGLLVPEPASACRIRVGGIMAHWEEGRSLLFDDTYRHEVWNDTDGRRAILFMDVIRPLRGMAAVANRFVLTCIAHSPLITDATTNYLAWEKRFEELTRSRGPD